MQHFDLDGAWSDHDLTCVAVTRAEAERFSLREGDVLFNTRNSYELVGKVGLVPATRQGYIFNNNLLRLRFKSNVLQEFAYRQMQAPIFRAMLEQQKSATTSVAAIYQGSLMRTPFWVPPIAEQREIVRRIETAFAKIDRIAVEAASARALLDRLDQAILAKAFRGELVPQDPSDEPAEKLLEKIKAARAAPPARKTRKKQR
jgi:type I restriction enzyme S subunit